MKIITIFLLITSCLIVQINGRLIKDDSVSSKPKISLKVTNQRIKVSRVGDKYFLHVTMPKGSEHDSHLTGEAGSESYHEEAVPEAMLEEIPEVEVEPEHIPETITDAIAQIGSVMKEEVQDIIADTTVPKKISPVKYSAKLINPFLPFWQQFILQLFRTFCTAINSEWAAGFHIPGKDIVCDERNLDPSKISKLLDMIFYLFHAMPKEVYGPYLPILNNMVATLGAVVPINPINRRSLEFEI